jgi:hypothetical protein
MKIGGSERQRVSTGLDPIICLRAADYAEVFGRREPSTAPGLSLIAVELRAPNAAM